MKWNFWKQTEKRNNVDYVTAYSDGLLFGKLSTKSNAMSISAVFSAVNLISNTIAMLPINLSSG